MINLGDIVNINKDDAGMNWIARAEVIHKPQGEGDLWGFKDLDTGAEIFTNERFTIYKRPATPASGGPRE